MGVVKGAWVRFHYTRATEIWIPAADLPKLSDKKFIHDKALDTRYASKEMKIEATVLHETG